MTSRHSQAHQCARPAKRIKKEEEAPTPMLMVPARDFIPAPMPNGRSLLLALPDELRLLVYEKLLEDEDEIQVCLPRTAKTLNDVLIAAPIAQINKQLRMEFLYFASRCGPLLRASILNFNFGHIITFLNKLSSGHLGQFKSSEHLSLPPRRLMFELHFKSVGFYSGGADLQRWLKRVEHPEKKGAQIRFEYKAHLSWWEVDETEPLFGDWGGSWRHVLQNTMPGKRSEEERKKIVEALREELVDV